MLLEFVAEMPSSYCGHFRFFIEKIRTIVFTLNEIDNFVKLISFKCSIFNK